MTLLDLNPALIQIYRRNSRGWAACAIMAGLLTLVLLGNRSPPSSRQPTDRNSISTDWSHIRVAVHEGSGFHDDVAGSFIYAAEQSGAQVTSYRYQGWRFGFDAILKTFHQRPTVTVGHGEPTSLDTAILRGEYDVVVLTSCDQRWINGNIRAALIKTPNVHILCMHHEGKGFPEHQSHFSTVAAEGRLQYVSLGQHTSNAYAGRLTEWAIKTQNPGWQRYPVQTFVAHFPIPSRIVHQRSRTEPRYDRFVIMGDVDDDQRHFGRIFRDLEADIKGDPGAWGYEYDVGQDRLTSLDASRSFELHILGKDKGKVKIPQGFENTVIHLHPGTTYEEYYEVLAGMDMVIPAWRNDRYWGDRASASICAAINNELPTLAFATMLEAYPYMEPLSYKLHYAGQGEIAILRALREGRFNDTELFDNNQHARPTWRATVPPQTDWEEYHTRLREWNVQILRDVYARLPRISV